MRGGGKTHVHTKSTRGGGICGLCPEKKEVSCAQKTSKGKGLPNGKKKATGNQDTLKREKPTEEKLFSHPEGGRTQDKTKDRNHIDVVGTDSRLGFPTPVFLAS